ncbi:MAG: sarcosine oxidase subunit gamma [Geodermatophilaceae bacterium]
MPDTGVRQGGRPAVPVARGPITVPGARSVVDGWEVSTRRSTAALRLSDASPLAKVSVRADADGALADAFGVRFRGSRHQDGVLVVGSGPGEWLLVGRAGTAQQIAETVRGQGQSGFVTTVDVTHGRALMRLTGRDAAPALSKVCAVDLSDAAAPEGAAFRTSVAKVATDVIRDDAGGGTGEVSYLLHCERSSGQYLFECLLDAGKEFGVEPEGWAG